MDKKNENGYELDVATMDKIAESATSFTRHASGESLIRGWYGGLACGGELVNSVPIGTIVENNTKDLSPSGVCLCDFYDVDRTLGKGGYGIVSIALHRESQRRCVVKAVNKKDAGDRYREKLVDGALYDCLLRMSVELPSPHIVKYFDLLEGVDNYFVVMEPLEGIELLEQFEKENFSVTESYIRRVMLQVLRALSHVHDTVGVVHRDIKLENFRFRRHSHDSELVLVDFGLARFIADAWDGSVSGTLLYLAPEAIRAIAPECKEGYGAPSDVWAAGVILYIALFGKVPWDDVKIWCLGKSETAAHAIVQESLADLKLESFTNEAMDLLRRLLEVDACSRVSATEASSHPWFAMPEQHLQQPLQASSECYKTSREASRTSQVITHLGRDAQAKVKIPQAKAALEKPLVKIPLCVGPPPPNLGSEEFM